MKLINIIVNTKIKIHVIAKHIDIKINININKYINKIIKKKTNY